MSRGSLASREPHATRDARSTHLQQLPIEERFRKLQHPILILQPHELLLEETRRVHAELIPQAHYVEIPQIVDDVFDTGWAEYAQELRRWLDAPVE